MTERLDGTVAFLTGASSSTRTATASALARQGAAVIVLGLRSLHGVFRAVNPARRLTGKLAEGSNKSERGEALVRTFSQKMLGPKFVLIHEGSNAFPEGSQEIPQVSERFSSTAGGIHPPNWVTVQCRPHCRNARTSLLFSHSPVTAPRLW
jgi:hypothetical protein